MLLRDDSEVRNELARRLGYEPHPVIWDELVDLTYVAEVIDATARQQDPEPSLREMERRYRRLEGIGEGQPVRKRSRKPRELPTGELEAALAQIVGEVAGQLPQVRGFRARSGALILFEHIADWVETRFATANAAARPTLWIEVPVEVPEDGLPPGNAILGYLREQLEHMAGATEWRLGRTRVEGLSYPRPDGTVDSRPIPNIMLEPGAPEVSPAVGASRELRALKATAVGLLSEFPGWIEAEAVTFVLTGQVPIPARGRAAVSMNRLIPAMGAVRLDLSPLADPAEVVALYRAARADLLGVRERVRTPRAAAVRLTEFVTRENTGITWAEAVERWNRSGSGRRYQDWHHFARDAARAYRQVTAGLELKWRGGRTERQGAEGAKTRGNGERRKA